MVCQAVEANMEPFRKNGKSSFREKKTEFEGYIQEFKLIQQQKQVKKIQMEAKAHRSHW